MVVSGKARGGAHSVVTLANDSVDKTRSSLMEIINRHPTAQNKTKTKNLRLNNTNKMSRFQNVIQFYFFDSFFLSTDTLSLSAGSEKYIKMYHFSE